MLLILALQAAHIYATTSRQLAAVGIDQLSIVDPMQAAAISANIYAILAPPILHLVAWLAPCAAILWAIV